MIAPEEITKWLSVAEKAGGIFRIFPQFFKSSGVDPAKIDPVLSPMSRCRGLIVFVSKGFGASSAKQAIDYHYIGSDGRSEALKLHYVALLHSPDSKEGASQLHHYVEKDLRVPCNTFGLDENKDVFDMKKVKDLIDDVVKNAKKEGIKESDIALELAGGTVPVSLAMCIAALVYGFNMEIMIPNETDDNGRAVHDKGSTPHHIELRRT